MTSNRTSAPHERLLARLDEAAPAMETRLIEWAEINSGSHNTAGLLQMGSLLHRALSELGAEANYVPLADADAPAVHACKHPAAPVRVLLSGHFDTVYAEASEFQRCERVDADTLRGPGVADMKGGLIVMLEALRTLESSELAGRLGWEVLLTPDEEVGSQASTPLLREAAGRCRLGIVFEPALPDGSIISSRKGVGRVRVIAHGRAAHAGRDFSRGRNAIVALAHYISAAHFLNHALPEVIVNAGSVTGGGAVNIVPDLAAAEFNIRATRAADGEEILRRLHDAAGAIGRANDVRIEVEGGFSRPPMEETGATGRWLDAWCATARDLGVALGRGHSGGGSDANILAAAGLACIDGIGVEGGELHSTREWVRLSSLPRRAKIAAAFLLRLAGGGIAADA